jgi:hypothetical protein
MFSDEVGVNRKWVVKTPTRSFKPISFTATSDRKLFASKIEVKIVEYMTSRIIKIQKFRWGGDEFIAFWEGDSIGIPRGFNMREVMDRK